MGIKFQHLYDNIYVYIKGNEVTFPQNFIPVPGLIYRNLRVNTTLTGRFTFEGKTYHVCRAYHSNFDEQGNPLDKVASIREEVEFLYKDKSKLDNLFAALSNLKL